MKISGSSTLESPVDKVWEAIQDPAVLARCLPGCESLAVIGEDRYAMSVTAGVAAIKGTYAGEVSLSDKVAPSSLTMRASGAGAPGTIDADVKVQLAPSAGGGTDLSYDADASVGGAIGGVGQRMLAGVTKKMAGQFFTALDRDIAGLPAGAAWRRGAAAGAAGAAGAAPASGAVYPAGPPRRTPTRPSTSTTAPASRSGCSSAACWPWPAWPSAPGSGAGPTLCVGGADARLHRRRRPGRARARAAHRRLGRGQPRQARRLHPPLRRGHRCRAGRAARSRPPPASPPACPTEAALGAGVRAARPGHRAAARRRGRARRAPRGRHLRARARPPRSSTTPRCSSTRAASCSGSTARPTRSAPRPSPAAAG